MSADTQLRTVIDRNGLQRSFIDRVKSIRARQRALNEEMHCIYAEARAAGFNKNIIGLTAKLEYQQEQGPAVYFIAFPALGRLKIGFSTNVQKRLVSLQHGVGAKGELLLVVAGDRTTEGHYHATFNAWRIRGEWFELNDETRHQVERVRASPFPVQKTGGGLVSLYHDVLAGRADDFRPRSIHDPEPAPSPEEIGPKAKRSKGCAAVAPPEEIAPCDPETGEIDSQAKRTEAEPQAALSQERTSVRSRPSDGGGTVAPNRSAAAIAAEAAETVVAVVAPAGRASDESPAPIHAAPPVDITIPAFLLRGDPACTISEPSK